ncbi:uroporphyrinogen-III C-methyltransferase [Paenibacillus flagellatus]|uniref:Uroporphyrinogen-III C-methyltransferase n=1 Tax=Paenibacillus flagellatus TaxID=2211139 RepID=A0A2V5JZ44_9BACL|nr:uroporphyrinogen-III C-methyltransferase [Paenibacillus flagellatus]PYI52209.1 uroporphyrinogen-III C-methyltransferase [Paenibacillus flagellatus]
MKHGRGLGKVYLVGAGPGDPKLITVRGLEAIERADAVVYDRLANPKLLRHAKPGADKIFVGKLPDKHMIKQEEISRLLVDLALQGKTVTRLKGGDPSVFGRVGEEAELLAEHGIEFEIVPGITSAIAVPAYAGIPVTHRDFTSSFSVVTGHEYPNKTYSNVNWENLANASGTIVFLMGVANIGTICGELMAHGRDPDTPGAVIRMGTWMEQRTVVGTLATLPTLVKEAGLQSPAIIIVGDVVKLREKLAWFEKRPLFGKRVLVTRAREQASELVRLIEERGGEAVEFPVIRIRRPERAETVRAVDEALRRLEEYDWILFTSANGVEYTFERMRELRVDVRQMYRAKIAAVGPKTQEALAARGLIADLVPNAGFQAESLLELLQSFVTPGERVLLPKGDLARPVLADGLRRFGAHVTEADVYENVPSLDGGEEALAMLRAGAVQAVAFTSSSTVTNLLEALRRLGEPDPVGLLNGVGLYVIGPVTAKTAAEAGLRVTASADEATIESLVEAMAR